MGQKGLSDVDDGDNDDENMFLSVYSYLGTLCTAHIS